ncbi:Odorant receptor [Nesidiocoris tenuis]|uniref:Odorant receptor n=1 Tax=Nesidiocoris tenuis TaxID=355587 RepID=A0ABN7AB86_9HEMI|nr:Odorant receptor [Nesidiocoris tenuis]
MDSKNTFDDTLGLPLNRVVKFYLCVTGHWVSYGQEPPPKRLKYGRIFGLFICSFVCFMGFTTLNAVKISVDAKNLGAIGNGLVILSTAISMLHKYSIYISQEEGISRLTEWMKSVEKRNRELKLERSPSEVFLRKSLRIFCYGALLSPWMLIVGPLVRGEPYCHRFPFLSDHVQKLITLPLVVITYNVLSWEVAFTATSLLNILVTFRTEVQRLGVEWKEIKFDPSRPREFSEKVKANVEKHVQLCKILKDLKLLNNSMFGYQVFAAILTTCAVIYGGSKYENFIVESTSQVLPVSSASLLEFALICWLGEEITFGLQEFHRDVHLTNWYEAPYDALTSLTIVLEFSKNPIQLTGFTVFTASLRTLIETMRQSFSLYTLLKALT